METSVNNKCKPFTSLEQSKKLAEILPLESADIVWTYSAFEDDYFPHFRGFGKIVTGAKDIKAWSLAALMNVIPFEASLNSFKDENWNAMIQHNDKLIYCDMDNPLDACYELIIKLHEQKLL